MEILIILVCLVILVPVFIALLPIMLFIIAWGVAIIVAIAVFMWVVGITTDIVIEEPAVGEILTNMDWVPDVTITVAVVLVFVMVIFKRIDK